MLRRHAIPFDSFRLILADAVTCPVASPDLEQLFHGFFLQISKKLLIHGRSLRMSENRVLQKEIIMRIRIRIRTEEKETFIVAVY